MYPTSRVWMYHSRRDNCHFFYGIPLAHRKSYEVGLISKDSPWGAGLASGAGLDRVDPGMDKLMPIWPQEPGWSWEMDGSHWGLLTRLSRCTVYIYIHTHTYVHDIIIFIVYNDGLTVRI